MILMMIFLLHPHLGGDGAVLVLVKDSEGLLEGGQLLWGEGLQDLLPVCLTKGSHASGISTKNVSTKRKGFFQKSNLTTTIILVVLILTYFDQ